MYKLITININETSGEVNATLEDNSCRRLKARQAATEIIAGFHEKDLPAIYEFLCDLTAEMAAMSDNPSALGSELCSKIDLYESEFQLVRRGLVPYRLGEGAKDMKS